MTGTYTETALGTFTDTPTSTWSPTVTPTATQTATPTWTETDTPTFTETDTPGLDNPWDFVNDPNDDTGTEDIWNIDETGVINNGYPYLTDLQP